MSGAERGDHFVLPAPVGRGRGPVRLQPGRGLRLWQTAFAPALAVVAAEQGIEAHLAHLPHPVFLDEAVVEDVDLPMRLAGFSVADHGQFEAAHARFASARQDLRDIVEQQVVVQHPGLQARRPHALHHLAHAAGAGIDAHAPDLGHAVTGEQVGDVVPHPAVDVVVVGGLQVAHLVLVIEHPDTLLQPRQRYGARRRRTRRGR